MLSGEIIQVGVNWRLADVPGEIIDGGWGLPEQDADSKTNCRSLTSTLTRTVPRKKSTG